MSKKNSYIYGRNAIIEALKNPNSISKIFLSFGVTGSGINQIYKEAQDCNIPVSKTDKSKFNILENEVCGRGNSQGVIALKNLVNTSSLDDLIKITEDEEYLPLILVLDRINDPHNLGAIARSAECAGVAGLLISTKESSPITPVAMKTSVGALEHLQVVNSSNLVNDIKYLKEKGYWVIGTDMNAEELYSYPLYTKPIVLVIGNEGEGMSQEIKDECDSLVKIPMVGKINSLNASVSAGIILFEILRQRTEPNSELNA